ncbi:hypothetical protein [Alkalilimnicola sp. S0819]|uniref:hypothetical protein n=1 Tax=Alkalilimnicola sp. S0819 TaxID=2613922 RepID=UPI001261BFBD|nr:hypothetical protein [Alkalilimnicola sp. S0819]KAB7627495.1 hypothetical protein F3N43_03260 [Alkalilimnicola sp. S0819]MPQ15648.1 hypothetical protein [Alkalilimnicola sp. S0819]
MVAATKLRCYRAGHLVLLLLFGSLTGCATHHVLPRSEQTVDSPWQSFEEAKSAYDRIRPSHTTTAELRELGYDPYGGANIRILSYLDLLGMFMPNDAIALEDLAPALRRCLAAKDRCYAYEASPAHAVDQRSGNLLLDIMSFRRHVVHSGWNFKALIVVHEERVVYKLWGGTPRINRSSTDSTPLGPLQQINLGRFM